MHATHAPRFAQSRIVAESVETLSWNSVRLPTAPFMKVSLTLLKVEVDHIDSATRVSFLR